MNCCLIEVAVALACRVQPLIADTGLMHVRGSGRNCWVKIQKLGRHVRRIDRQPASPNIPRTSLFSGKLIITAASSGNQKGFFLQAIEIQGIPADRQQFLDEVRGDDTSLRRRVEGLILAHESPEPSYGAAPQLDGRDGWVPRLTVWPSATGGRSGPTSGQPIGVGGMGVAWAAEHRTHGVARWRSRSSNRAWTVNSAARSR